MTLCRIVFGAALVALAGCGHPSPEPEEVTTTVTDGDEQAWSEPGDPPIDEPHLDGEDDDSLE